MAKSKGGEGGYGEGDNVHDGPGSKHGKTTGKARVGGESFAGSGERNGGHGTAGADATEKTHNAEFAKGGKQHMFGEQEANDRSEGGEGITGKRDVHGPGEKFAEGGKNKMFNFNPAKLATAGITSAY